MNSIRSHASVHDKAQAEIRFHYNFDGDQLDKVGFLHRKHTLRQDMYFVFPGQWRVNKSNYPSSEFIGDVNHFIRFREPYVKFSFILPNRSNKENPYSQLIKVFESLDEHHTKEDIESAQRLIRAFGAGYSAQFSKRINKKIERMAQLLDNDGLPPTELQMRRLQKNIISLDQNIRKAYLVMRNWRSLVSELFGSKGSGYLEPILEEFHLLDEYCSILFVDAIGGVYKTMMNPWIEKIGHVLSADTDHLEFTMRSHLRLERKYQKQRRFKLSEAKNRIAKEYALSRFRALKRHIWSVLYTHSQKRVKVEFSKHFGPAMAAGFAALWAFAANVFVLVNYPDIIQGGQGINTLLGANGLFAVAVIVLAYIVKDRIKEISRGLFNSDIRRGADHSLDVSFEEASGQVVPICTLNEKAIYQQHSDIHIKVFGMMKKHGVDLDINLAERSSILKLERELIFDLIGIRDSKTPSSSISDIIRVNFDRFQSIMGDPKKEMYVMDQDGEIVAMRLPKVYYCDLIIVTHSKTQQNQVDTHYQYRRFVINKKGLIRCDQLE